MAAVEVIALSPKLLLFKQITTSKCVATEPKKPVPRNSRRAANSRGTARGGSRSLGGTSSQSHVGRVKGPLGLGRGPSVRAGHGLFRPCPPAAAGRSAENQETQLSPVSGQRVCARWAAPHLSGGCGRGMLGTLTAGLSTRSRSKAVAGGKEARPARGAEHTRCSRRSGTACKPRPASLGRHGMPQQCCLLPGPGHPQSAKIPLSYGGGDLRKPKSGSAQQLEPGLEAARCAGG